MHFYQVLILFKKINAIAIKPVKTFSSYILIVAYIISLLNTLFKKYVKVYNFSQGIQI